MSDYIAARIKKPRFYALRPVKSKPSKPRYVIGFDSEADTSSQGYPMLFQFSIPGASEEDTLIYEVPTTKYGGLKVFLDFLDKYCTQREYQYLIYVWNLSYELTQIFHDLPREYRGEDHITITPASANGDRVYEWTIDVLNIKRQIVRFTKGKIVVSLYDGRAFYNTSLDKAARMLGLGQKYEASGIDRSLFTRDDLSDPDFVRYAKRDAFITRKIGEYIAADHDQWGIPTTISAPHLASTVFKTNYLTSTINAPSGSLEQAGLFSYHGGKNGFYLDGPHDFPDIYDYDITSAYPEAMRQLPDIQLHTWRPRSAYFPNTHALYCVTGEYRACKWRGMQNHDGAWIDSRRVEDIWITSYELDQMIANHEFDIESIHGFEMTGKPGGPLADYVDHFFHLKSHTTGPQRETAKLMLNSLYGKFFQKQALGQVGYYNLDTHDWIKTNIGKDYDYEAGGLYHPPIASLITGFVRARIHGLEHKYDAVMTSTDGFFGFTPPDPNDLGSGLGQLKASRGRLQIWRERLYIFNSGDQRQFALHGFRGNVSELQEIPLAKGEYLYEGKQMVTLKQSLNKQAGVLYEPGTFVTLPYRIII